jgi:hypothetical protein
LAVITGATNRGAYHFDVLGLLWIHGSQERPSEGLAVDVSVVVHQSSFSNRVTQVLCQSAYLVPAIFGR